MYAYMHVIINRILFITYPRLIIERPLVDAFSYSGLHKLALSGAFNLICEFSVGQSFRLHIFQYKTGVLLRVCKSAHLTMYVVLHVFLVVFFSWGGNMATRQE